MKSHFSNGYRRDKKKRISDWFSVVFNFNYLPFRNRVLAWLWRRSPQPSQWKPSADQKMFETLRRPKNVWVWPKIFESANFRRCRAWQNACRTLSKAVVADGTCLFRKDPLCKQKSLKFTSAMPMRTYQSSGCDAFWKSWKNWLSILKTFSCIQLKNRLSRCFFDTKEFSFHWWREWR